MVNLDLAELRLKLDLENKYVDFALVRNALSVGSVVKDLQINLSVPTKDAECRGTCPKCSKEKSFSLNMNTNRFNCFAKGCALKGGGVIDFFAKLFEVPAKEASHLLACAYGIQPYTSEMQIAATNAAAAAGNPNQIKPETAKPNMSGEVSRDEFENLEKKFERLSTIVWSLMFEKDEIDAPVVFDLVEAFDKSKDCQPETSLAG